jgi:aryl-alcohol dehydrogenase-like predicted oxidoreductase
MGLNRSRREFLHAGLAIPAAGLVSSNLDTALQKEPPKITYRTLGKTGLKVTGVGYGIGYEPNVEVVNRAIDLGINYFDTSRDYKESEAIFASCIKNGRRQKIHISSKSGSTKKDEILKDMDTSLKTLGTDYVEPARARHAGTHTGRSAGSHGSMQEVRQGALHRLQLS